MKAEVCPECGSAKLEIQSSILKPDDRQASCFACGWKGTAADLISAIVPEGEGLSGDQGLKVAEQVATTYMGLIAQHVGHPIGRAMIEAGIVGLHDKEGLTRLIRAACSAAYAATLEEVEAMQRELVDDRSN